ncbi:MAG: M81 family metallopeptidase, partial [Burkholderiaceae bacterium]
GNSNTELAGFLDAARAHGWHLQHVLSAIAQPAGRLTTDAFERLAGAIVAAAEKATGQLDGVALGLHGAMVAEGYDDGEGELLRRLRKVLGPQVPIAITLDLHANVTRAMCEHANIIVSYRTYPHVDMRDTARRAGDILQRSMAGEIRPVTLRAHLPMIDETNGGRTDVGDMLPRLDKARAYENQPDVFAVSINAGFSRADITEIGPTVLITAQGDLPRHTAFAQELADDIWACRHNLINRFMSVQEAAAECLAHEGEGRPIVVADYSDNPGGGAYGDATALLGALLDAGVKRACFGPVFDPQTVQALQATPLGAVVSVQLGGKTDARLGGGPLALRGSLEHKSDGRYYADGPMAGGLHRSWGPTVVLRVQDIDILVVSLAAQILDLAQFTSFGIDPRAKKVVALKSMQHFRAAFEPIASKVIVCDSGALCTPDPGRLTFVRVPRPLFPLEQDIDLAAWRRAEGYAVDAAPAPAQVEAEAASETTPAPVPKSQKQRPPRDAALGVLEQLAGWYPQLFGAVFRPLKRGIFQDLVSAHPDGLDSAGLRAALALHTRSTRYLAAVANGEKRHDLAGKPVEEMAPEHVFHALAEVFRRRQGRSSEDLSPRLRERIAQAFDASGLTREAYAELAHGRDEALNTLVEAALAEAAARCAKDEALLRTFDASGQSIETFCDMYGMDAQVVNRSLSRARQRLSVRAA